jgi:hypothetical protein
MDFWAQMHRVRDVESRYRVDEPLDTLPGQPRAFLPDKLEGGVARIVRVRAQLSMGGWDLPCTCTLAIPLATSFAARFASGAFAAKTWQ